MEIFTLTVFDYDFLMVCSVVPFVACDKIFVVGISFKKTVFAGNCGVGSFFIAKFRLGGPSGETERRRNPSPVWFRLGRVKTFS